MERGSSFFGKNNLLFNNTVKVNPKFTFFIILLLCFIQLSAQKDALYFEHINRDDGLSSNTVNAVFEDSEGFIWIGTELGLNRYSGSDIHVFLHEDGDSSSLANNDVKGSVNNRLIKEMLLATLNGIILALFLFLFVWGYERQMDKALAISVSLVAVIIVAGLIGTFVPLFLDKRGIDPAIATGPFITTSNDIFGILIYFTIAKFILGV